MEKRSLTRDMLETFRKRLIYEEKSKATVEKYMRDAEAFKVFLNGKAIEKGLVVAYKNELTEKGYAIRSINSMLVSLNQLLRFCGLEECRVKLLRYQQQVYRTEGEELTKAEYMRLLKASEGKKKMNLVMQTICSTGIRVSELKYFTVEAVRRGEVTVRCKNKTRTILMPGKLKKMLLLYAKRCGIAGGAIFVSKRGKPLDRFYVWAQMKKLCRAAAVDPAKVYPHNLRKLFARAFYAIEKDIAKLADILGHSSINTTRIYIMTTCTEHRRRIDRLKLVAETIT